MSRTIVAGGPRVGKSSLSLQLAAAVGVCARSTDELVGILDYASAAGEVATWIDHPGPWVIEGVTAVRALRFWLADHSEGMPCDQVYWSEVPKVTQTDAQASMARGCKTVWKQIVDDLQSRGVLVHFF